MGRRRKDDPATPDASDVDNSPAASAFGSPPGQIPFLAGQPTFSEGSSLSEYNPPPYVGEVRPPVRLSKVQKFQKCL
eukprot:3554550-Pyramimonas_sp.AAC.2